MASIDELDVSLSGTKRPRPPLATTTLFRVYTTFLFSPLQRRCFRTSHGHTRATLSHYQIACTDLALALYQRNTWHSTDQ